MAQFSFFSKVFNPKQTKLFTPHQKYSPHSFLRFGTQREKILVRPSPLPLHLLLFTFSFNNNNNN